MDELTYYKAKAKLLEFQSIRFQLQEQLAQLNVEKADYFYSIGLNPRKNYLFDDEKMEFTEINPNT